MLALVRKLKANAAELGALDAFLYGVHRLIQKFGERHGIFRYRLVAQPVRPAPVLGPNRGRAIEVRVAAPDDPALAPLPLTPSVLRYRFQQNAVCFIAVQNGATIGCLWLCLGPYQEDEVRCRFVPKAVDGAAWDFDVYVRPDHRIGFCLGRLWDEANRFLRERGIAWSMSRISAFNRQSLGAHSRLGARALGTVTFVRLGAMQLTLASLPPYVHLSFGGAGPELVVPIAAPVPGEQPQRQATGA